MFEAYKIGIRLTLLNGVSAGLMSMVSGFQSLDKQVSGVNRKLSDTEKAMIGIKRRMLVGGALAATGGFGLGIVAKTLPAAKEYAHQLALMNAAGMRHLEIVKATQAAWAASKTAPTSSVTENLAAIRDLRMVFGNTADATRYMPVVQKVQAILQNLRHGEGGSGRSEAYEMAKALEMKGAVRTPGEFMREAELMTRALQATGGKVSATDFLSAFKYGRTATAGWNDQFTYSILPTLIQEMKGGSGGGGKGGPGNAIMSAYAAVVGGTIPQKALKVWQKLGLLDPSKIVWNKVGSAKGVEPGGVMGSGLFQASPYEWAQKYLAPALQKAGYKTMEQQKEALQYLFPNRTAGFVMSQMITQAWKFQRDMRLIGQAKGLSAYGKLLKTDPEMAQLALQKQWQSLLAILGYQIMPVVLKGTLLLIDGLRPLGRFFYHHAWAAKALMVSLVGLSAILFATGAGLTLWGAFSLLGVALKLTPIGGVAGIASVGSALVGFGKGLATMAASVMTNPYVLAIMGGAAAGYAAGTGLNYLINKGVHALTGDASLGGWIYSATHKPGENVTHVHIHLDGKKIAHHIVGPKHDTGTSSLNFSAHAPTPATPGMVGY